MIRYRKDGSVDVATSPFTNLEVAELVDALDRMARLYTAATARAEAAERDAEKLREAAHDLLSRWGDDRGGEDKRCISGSVSQFSIDCLRAAIRTAASDDSV
jgi:hypothetical protein